ncbi:MAG: CRR6 family NdhI maturation factor [Synechococcus lacustris]|jgi:hypothetical protein
MLNTCIAVGAAQLRQLDLTPLAPLAALPIGQLLAQEDKIQLSLDWPRDEADPRELSEIPECRLWSLRADAQHPWLPLLLERSSGQLSRHVAMLVPHSFSRTEGIRFDADALSLWISHRLFLLDHWGQQHQIPLRGRLGQMAAVLGFELDPAFWPPA